MERIVRLIRPWATPDGPGHPRLDGHGSARPNRQPGLLRRGRAWSGSWSASSSRPAIRWSIRAPGSSEPSSSAWPSRLTLVPIALADGLRPASPDRLPGRLVARDPALGVGRDRRRRPRRPAPAGTPRAPDRAVHDRPRPGRRGDALRRTLTAAAAYRSLVVRGRRPRQARRPSAPVDRHPTRPPRSRTPRLASPQPSRPPATRSSISRTGSTPTRSRPSRRRTPRPGWPRASRRHGFAVEHPAGQPGDRGPRHSAVVGPATARGSGSSPSTTRCRVSVTAAATTRWRPPGSGPRSPSPRWPTSSPARSSSSARRPRSGGAASRS